MSDIKLSNVIGAPFSAFVLNQLYKRAQQNSSTTRTNNQVLFLANKLSWARLVSSVNVALPAIDNTSTIFQIGGTVASSVFYENLGLNYTDYPRPDSLAKKWILEAGTSVQNGNGINLRRGIGPDGAYGLGGTEELGYRPMPGLNSVQVQTMGTLGSLRQATISFKVWNMNQLNVIEALYFRLGYSMLLEWGHVQYFQNDNVFKQDGIYGIDDPFRAGRRKENIQQEIAKKVKETDGNYDGMLGVVSNFNWSFNQSGGYDCTVRLIGLGAIMDSLRIDQTYTLPAGFIARFKKDEAALEEEAARLRATPPPTGAGTAADIVTESEPKTIEEAYALAKKYGNYTGTFEQFINPRAAEVPTRYAAFSNYVSKLAAFELKFPVSTTRPNPNATQDQITRANEKLSGVYTFRSDYVSRLLFPASGTPIPITIDLGLLSDYLKTFFDRNKDIYSTSSNEGKFLYTDYFLQYLQAGTDTYLYEDTDSRGNPIKKTGVLGLDELLKGSENITTPVTNRAGINFNRDVAVTYSIPSGDNFKIELFEAVVQVANPDVDYPVTRRKILEIFNQAYRAGSGRVNGELFELERSTSNNAYINLKAGFRVDAEVDGVGAAAGKKKTISVEYIFKTDNPAFVRSRSSVTAPPVPPATGTASTGDTTGASNTPSDDQVETPKGFESALHAMLTIIKARIQAASLKRKLNVDTVDILEPTQKFYDSGILKDVFISTPSTDNKTVQFTTKKPPVAGPKGIPFNVTDYALKGFNSELMRDPTLYDTVPDIDFKNLCTGLIVRYPYSSPGVDRNILLVPTYITFGYLLAFINNMCLVYDTVKPQTTKEPTGDQKHPYVYLDFNPETNFCLTSPQQFSIDPHICLIPLQSTLEQYQAIYPESVVIKDKDGKITELKNGDKFFNPKSNPVSTVMSKVAPFQNTGAPYQGKIMNIFLNIDYLLRLANSYQGSDPEHAVRLQPFLEAIITDINKALGNINLFKVKYRDDTNTIQIQDSQWAPSLSGEESIMKADAASLLRGTLPVFGRQSLAREFQFKTVISTKLASTIAISAQAATGSINATDHSSYSWLNQNYQDRYKPYIQDPDNKASGTSNTGKKSTNDDSNEVKAAAHLNKHVELIYANPQDFTNDRVEFSKNYYVEIMSKAKSADPTTVASPFIPADLELTIDGIGGIIMGNAFLVPEDRMPQSLRGVGGNPKVGFIVTSLMHTIENNQWLTKMRGQMIKLRGYSGFGTVATIGGTASTVNIKTEEGSTGGARRSGAVLVSPPNFVSTSNFNTYYPGYIFRKGTSDINLTAFGLSPLSEAEITDDTTKNRYKSGTLTSPVPYFVIHHTAGRGDADLVYKVLYDRGVSVQYVIDRSGRIFRFMPDGAIAYHAGSNAWNNRSMGVEVIAKDDADVLPVQINAAIRLAHYLGFQIANIIGHGKISNDRGKDEGFTIVSKLNPNYKPGFDPSYG